VKNILKNSNTLSIPMKSNAFCASGVPLCLNEVMQLAANYSHHIGYSFRGKNIFWNANDNPLCRWLTWFYWEIISGFWGYAQGWCSGYAWNRSFPYSEFLPKNENHSNWYQTGKTGTQRQSRLGYLWRILNQTHPWTFAYGRKKKSITIFLDKMRS